MESPVQNSNVREKPLGAGYTCEQVVAEIQNQQAGKKHWIRNVLILLISLFVFFQLGLFQGGVRDVLIIVIVLLIHETGHFLGMRAFGYKNVRMFFIPFFGAAVSGSSRNVAGYKRAIVSLLGPVPGILLGIVFLVLSAATRTRIYFQFALLLIIINGFNLLPFFPLDGGRFLHEILFSRNRYIELGFRLLAGAALVLVGVLLGAWLLAAFGLFALASAKMPFQVARIAAEMKQQLAAIWPDAAEAGACDTDKQQIPSDIAESIIEKIHRYISPTFNLRTMATCTQDVWERMHLRPPGLAATLALLSIYLLFFLLPLGAIVFG